MSAAPPETPATGARGAPARSHAPRTAPALPVDAVLPQVLAALAPAGGAAVLQAPPGAGKTTRVPLALLASGTIPGRILLLEPRRLAARAAAERMAATLGEPVGRTVGCRMRGETRISAATRIEVLTEGILTRMLQDDPGLAGVGALIFDEFHERSLEADLGLALALEARAVLRPDLRLLVMSATLDTAPVTGFIGAPVLRCEGRTFPVETHWLERPQPPRSPVEPLLAETVLQALAQGEGGILAFLPGEAEIRRTQALLRPRLPAGVDLHALYGALSPAAQRAALAPGPARKVVLASAIAETSLTIEGIRAVVDSGLARRAVFDAGAGMARLVTTRVSRAEAEQRRGRAGRVASGRCWRLWARGEEGALAAQPPVAIESADLTALALELALWGSAELSFLTPPPAAALARARELLAGLGALDDGGRITAHGRRLAALPLHPRLAHMLLAAGPPAAPLAALIEARDPLRGAGGCDLGPRLALLADPARFSRETGLPFERGEVQRLRHEAARLARMAGPRGTGARARGKAAGAPAAADAALIRRKSARGRDADAMQPDSVPSGPVPSGPVQSGSAQSGPAQSGPAQSDPVQSRNRHPILANPETASATAQVRKPSAGSPLLSSRVRPGSAGASPPAHAPGGTPAAPVTSAPDLPAPDPSAPDPSAAAAPVPSPLSSASPAEPAPGQSAGTALALLSPAQMAALAFPDRVALRRSGHAPRYLLANGKGARMDGADPLAGVRLLVVTDSDGARPEARIRLALPLTEDELRAVLAPRIRWQHEVLWDGREDRLRARRVERLGALELAFRPWPEAPPEARARAALERLRETGLSWSPAARRLAARMALLPGLPPVDEAGLLAGDALLPWLTACRSRTDLQALDLVPVLESLLGPGGRGRLEAEAPAAFTTPAGRRVPIDYGGEAPQISVRLQEMFGTTRHPCAGGRPLAVTLLSPAGRPLQTTTDLPAFWAGSYAEVRKEMRGRYPRHPWPEDPASAPPTLRAKPRNR